MRKYQLIQHALDRYELKLVTVDREAFQVMIDGIVAELREVLGKRAAIESEYCEQIMPEGTRKFKHFISLCK